MYVYTLIYAIILHGFCIVGFHHPCFWGQRHLGLTTMGYPKTSTDESYFPYSTSHFNPFSASIFQKQVEKAKVENFGPLLGRLLRERGLSRLVDFALGTCAAGFRMSGSGFTKAKWFRCLQLCFQLQALSDDQCSKRGQGLMLFWTALKEPLDLVISVLTDPYWQSTNTFPIIPSGRKSGRRMLLGS